MTLSYLQKHSLTLSGHRTSVALEPDFWEVLEEIASSQQQTLASFIAELDYQRDSQQPLSSVLRLEALRFLRKNQKNNL